MGRVIGALVNEFNISNTYGIFVEATAFGSNTELVDQISLEDSSSENTPNVVAAPASQLFYWNSSGHQFIDLNAYIQYPVTGLSKQEIADFFSPFWQEGEISDYRFGIPAYRSGQLLFYNQSWAQELGFINPPISPNEFKMQACAAAKFNAEDAKRANNGTGGWIIDTSWQMAYSWLRAFGFHSFPVDETSSYVFSRPQAEEMIDFFREFSDEGCAWTARDPLPYEYFSTRQALFYSGTLEEIPIQVRTNLRLQSADQWTVIPYPGLNNEKITLTEGQDYAVFASDPKEQLASWLFIKWLIQPKNQSKLVEAATSFPLTYSSVASLSDLGETYPMWQQALGYISGMQVSPKLGSWIITQQIMEDAFWKSLQANTPKDELPLLLHELDATIHEVLGQ